MNKRHTCRQDSRTYKHVFLKKNVGKKRLKENNQEYNVTNSNPTVERDKKEGQNPTLQEDEPTAAATVLMRIAPLLEKQPFGKISLSINTVRASWI